MRYKTQTPLLIVTLILVVLARVTGEASQVRYSSLATALFPIPFLLFSPLAGYLADRFPKHRVLLCAKLPEILAMTALGGVRGLSQQEVAPSSVFAAQVAATFAVSAATPAPTLVLWPEDVVALP